MLVAKNSFATSHFYPKNKILISVYKGRSNVELGVSHLKCILEFYSKHEVKGSIVDISKIFGSFSKGINFIEQSYYPTAIKSGLVCQAFVVPKDIIVETLSNKLLALASSCISKAKLFTDRAKAEEWMIQYLENNSSTSS